MRQKKLPVKTNSIPVTRTEARLDSLDAYLVAFEEGSEAGLEQLQGKNDPFSIRRRLAILLEAFRFQEAAASVRNVPLDEEWCDKAIIAFARDGDDRAANEVLQWARERDDVNLARRCQILFAEASFVHALRNRPEGSVLLPGQVSTQEGLELRNALQIVKPFIQSLQAEQHLRTEMEVLAVQIALRVHLFLGEYDQVEALGILLLTRNPIPLFAADLVLDNKLSVPADMLDRLRSEHPGKFRAQLLALLIENKLVKQPKQAFEAAKRLISGAHTAEEQEQALRTLSGFAQELGPAAFEEVEQIVSTLPNASTRFQEMLEAERALRAGDTESAKTLLESGRDDADPYWLQLQTYWLLQTGNGDAATDCIMKAGKLAPHPDLLHRAAAIAFEHGRMHDAAEALEILLRLQPRDIDARRNLATIYTQNSDFIGAATQFSLLREQMPDDPSYAINEAEARARSGDLNGSLQVYEAVCGSDKPPLVAILRRAELLEVDGHPHEAFLSLMAWKSEHWDSEDYIAALLRLAFAADEETTGHEALLRLKELQAEGRASVESLQEKTLDDFVSYFREQREQEQELHRQMLQGRMPWLLVDRVLGSAAYSAWAYRTQPLTFLGEEPTDWARFVVYATNGFHSVTVRKSTASLERLQCPSAGTAVAIDLSSLFTLHRLGILDQAANYFGRLLYPHEYLEQVLGEASRLVFHQLSQKTAIERIKSALDDFRIAAPANPSGSHETISPASVREYVMDDDRGSHYKIRDIATALHQAGLITDVRFAQTVHDRATTQADNPELPLLRPGQALNIELSTLKTLTHYSLLEPLLRGFKVEISPKDQQQVIFEARGVTNQQRLIEWHKELWEFIRQRTQFVPVAKTMTERVAERDDNDSTIADTSIAAVRLAEQMNVPLMADDRVCQVLALNARPKSPAAAFSTDRLLAALSERGMLTADQSADALLQLMRWRYRFLLPSADILKTLADRHVSHPPGSELQEVALYVHECMRDPGLFSGLEPTDPPVTMGNRLYQNWAAVIAEFIMDCWADACFTDDAANALTRWAVRELLPSPPLTMASSSNVLPSRTSAFVLNHAVIRSVGIQDPDRANRGIQAVGDELGMTDAEYFTAVSRLVDEA